MQIKLGLWPLVRCNQMIRVVYLLTRSTLPSPENENENDHLVQSVLCTLAPWARVHGAVAPSQFGKLLASCRKNLSKCCRASLVTFGMKWACPC